MYFFARMNDYYLVFNGLTCGTLYAHEDQVEAIEQEYSGTVVPLEDVYTLSVNATYPRTLVLEATANEKLMTDGVSLKSVDVGRTTATAGVDGLYVAKSLLPSTTYTCTLTFMYGTAERTDELSVTTEDFWDEATVQSVTPFSATFAITLNEDPYSDGPDEYGIVALDGTTYCPVDADGTVTIAGLAPKTEYTFELYANYDNVTMKGGSVTATTDELIVTTAEATDITATSATLHGSVTAGTEDILSQGFEYWTTENEVLTVEAEDMSATLTDLTPGTTYYYKAYAKTEYGGTTYGEEISFTTLIVAPTVQTLAATGITHNSATLNGTVTAGSEEILEQGFEYRLATSSEADVLTVTGSGEEMSVAITGLKAVTTYIFCAYVRTASKTYYGEEKAFTTTAIIAPTAQTYAASDITSTSAVLHGYVQMGSEEIAEQGFEYWAKDVGMQTVTTTGDYMSVMVTGLKSNTKYTFHAYAITVSGMISTTAFGDDMTFTTDVPNGIETMTAEETEVYKVARYTTDGKQVPSLQQGMNIIRYSDGTARKVLVK